MALLNSLRMSDSHVLTSDSQVGLLSEEPQHYRPTGEPGSERTFPAEIRELLTLCYRLKEREIFEQFGSSNI